MKHGDIKMLKRLIAAGLLLSAVAFAGSADAAGYGSSSSGNMMGSSKAPMMMKASPMMAPWHRVHTAKGTVWADSRGMVLYTFEKDPAGKPTCYGKCAIAWPPFRAAPGSHATGKWTPVMRGFMKQWALNGKPLYFWFKDLKPGDATGDGIDGFHLAR
jgi:predicted lipoprotein with Yx(FWY)xxD motif